MSIYVLTLPSTSGTMNEIQSGFTCSECLRKCSLFKALSKEELDNIYEHRYDTTFRAGEVIAKQGSPISNVVSLSEGLAQLVL